MERTTRKTIPWTILLSVIAVALVVYFLVMLRVSVHAEAQKGIFVGLLAFMAAVVSLASIFLVRIGSLARVQEARFLATIDSMGDALLITDTRQMVIHANPAACSLFATDFPSLVGRALPDSLARQVGKAESSSEFARSLADAEKPRTMNLVLNVPDRRERPVSVVNERILDASGKDRGSVYMIRDLTEWNRLAASITATFLKVQIDDSDHAVVRALDEAASMCGAEVRALLLFGAEDTPWEQGQSGACSTAGGLSPRVERWARGVSASGKMHLCSLDASQKEDFDLLSSELLAWATVLPLWYSGIVIGAIVLASHSVNPTRGLKELAVPALVGDLAVELLAKKWAMREVNRLREEFDDLVDTSSVPIWAVDSDGRVIEWNNAIARVTGREKNPVLGLHAGTLIDSETEAFPSILSEVLAGKLVAGKEMTVRAASENLVTILVSGTPRKNSAGRVTGAVFIGQDISARVVAERRIKEQARALVEVQEIERLRVSRDLHDDVSQDLSAARLACETLLDGIEGSDGILRERAAKLSQALFSSVRSVRRIAYDLRPWSVEQVELNVILQNLCESFGQMHDLEVTFQSAGTGEMRLPPEDKRNLYRIVQESTLSPAHAIRHGNWFLYRELRVSAVTLCRVVEASAGESCPWHAACKGGDAMGVQCPFSADCPFPNRVERNFSDALLELLFCCHYPESCTLSGRMRKSLPISREERPDIDRML